MITGLIVGLAMFFEVGFVLLLPLVFTIVASSGLPLLYVGVPMVAALSVTHCFLPPHPGPTAIATIFEANLGTTLLYGLIITIPTVIVAGPLFSKLLARFEKAPPEGLFNPHLFSEEEMPSFWNSIFAAVIPVILMAIAAVCEITLPKRMPCGFSSNLLVIQQWRCLLPLSSPFLRWADATDVRLSR